MNETEKQLLAMVFLIAVLALVMGRRNWRASGTAYGRARFASEKLLQAAGMLGQAGLILGRTVSGKLIRLAELLSCAANRCYRLGQRGEHYHPATPDVSSWVIGCL